MKGPLSLRLMLRLCLQRGRSRKPEGAGTLMLTAGEKGGRPLVSLGRWGLGER